MKKGKKSFFFVIKYRVSQFLVIDFGFLIYKVFFQRVLTLFVLVSSKGYGIFVNSSDGGVHVEGGHIAEIGGDGIRYFGHEYVLKDRKNVFDLCTLPTTSSQTFPLLIELQQDIYSANRKECEKVRKLPSVLSPFNSMPSSTLNDPRFVDIHPVSFIIHRNYFFM